MIDNGGEIFADARVIGAEEAVGLAGAAAAVPGEGVPASLLEGEGHAADVFGGGYSFEAVADDGEALMFLGRPIEVEEVAIWEFKTFTDDCGNGDASKKGGVDGGEVASPQAERCTIGGVDEWHWDQERVFPVGE